MSITSQDSTAATISAGTEVKNVVNENGDVAFTLNSPNLEFFSKLVGGKRYGPRGDQALEDRDMKVWGLLDRMWAESPELTVKNIFYKGDCRGGAKEKRLFIVGALWLLEKHPEYANLEHVPEYRYWRDLVTLAEKSDIAEKKVVQLFAKQLLIDIVNMWSKGPVSLCAKWTPTEGCAEDRRNPRFLPLLRAALVDGTPMTPRSFRQIYLSPLRKHIKIVEKLMCANQWGEIDYSQVPSVAMHQYRKIFKKHDPTRFNEWKAGLSKGVGKVNVSQLFPHTVCEPYLRNGKRDELTEAQFKSLTEQVRKMGSFSRSLVIADTSGSMNGTPMDVAVSLGILMARCLGGPFRGMMINFSDCPRFTRLSEEEDLHADISTMRRLQWGGSTNLDAVFDLLLKKAAEFKVPADEMPNRLYILTDMQFNQVEGFGSSYSGAFYSCNEEKKSGALTRAAEKFKAAGYQVPEIVCWNLRGDTDTSAMPDDQPGCATITGFSISVLSAVMKGKLPDPLTVMKEALRSSRYERLLYPGKPIEVVEEVSG